MPSDFAGSTAEHYVRFRRDVPDGVLDDLVDRLGVGPDALAIDLGAGTGQVAVPLAARVGTVVAMEPEPAMAVLLRRRTTAEQVSNVLTLLASDHDLPALTMPLGKGACGLVTVANALHWMDAPEVFRACHRLLRPGGGVAVIAHGVPLWLGETDWARSLRAFLESWTGQPASGSCGTDDATRQQREEQLRRAGFADVSLHVDRYESTVDADYVIGHLYSAMSESMVPAKRRPQFEDGVRRSLDASRGQPLVEEVPITVLIGRR
ncbi:SAM-dependent methyltransferase [Blastococcus sp. CT_GayMR20]|nr:SAM-dependent methyltransferase [Blastococcus sp. CT_GayMR20]